jgi:hypothetical protein
MLKALSVSKKIIAIAVIAVAVLAPATGAHAMWKGPYIPGYCNAGGKAVPPGTTYGSAKCVNGKWVLAAKM